MEMFISLLLAGLAALKEYIALHVLTCLIPAFLLAGAIITFVSRETIIGYLGSAARKVSSFGTAAGGSFFVAACGDAVALSQVPSARDAFGHRRHLCRGAPRARGRHPRRCRPPHRARCHRLRHRRPRSRRGLTPDEGRRVLNALVAGSGTKARTLASRPPTPATPSPASTWAWIPLHPLARRLTRKRPDKQRGLHRHGGCAEELGSARR